jgi:hypothetical protein
MILFETDDAIEQVFSPYSGVVSLVVELASGEMIEAAMIGRKGIVGGLSALNSKTSISRAIVQIAGTSPDIANLSAAAAVSRKPPSPLHQFGGLFYRMDATKLQPSSDTHSLQH